MSELKLNDFIKAYEEIKKQNFIVDSINKDFFLEFAECLIEKVKELETENHTQRKIIMSAYDRGWIPKQKIKDIFEETQKLYEENIKQIDFKEIEKIDIKIFKGIKLETEKELLRKLLKESEDKNANNF